MKHELNDFRYLAQNYQCTAKFAVPIDFLVTSGIILFMNKQKDYIPLSVREMKFIKSLGFSCAEILTIGVCLTLTDTCWCSNISTTEIITTLGISQRSFYYTMEKLKFFGVVKENHRYDYSKFVEQIENEMKRLDNIQDS